MWRRLVTPRWLAVHLGVLVLVVAFLLLGWWQITRAADGNTLSFGYSFEWPLFAAFVIWVWAVEVRKVVRAEPSDAPTAEQSEVVRPDPVAPASAVTRRRPRNEAAYDDSDDPQLAAYNHYLAWRNAHPYASPADYPGVTVKETT